MQRRYRWYHTDTVVIDENGHVTEAKAPSTPDDFARDFDSLESLPRKEGSHCKITCKEELVSHGTTVGTNAIIEGEGTNTALVTTRGAEDAIFIMRAATGRSKGLPIEDVLQFQESGKPDPIIPRSASMASTSVSTAWVT